MKILWPVPSSRRIQLEQEEIHLWVAELDALAGAFEEMCLLLSPDERTRAQRYRFPKDKNRFVLRRGLLRQFLNRYLPDAGAEFRFAIGPAGKPELVLSPGSEPLHFSVSHSHGLALYAFTLLAPVGVDIECVRPIDNLLGVAARVFLQPETEALRALPDASRLEAFYNCWTRKEACLKAMGLDLEQGLAGVEVTLVPGEPARVLNFMGEAGVKAQWFLQVLQPAEGYVAALACRGPVPRLVCYAYPTVPP